MLSPLIAALAMSGSSLLVVSNALRLTGGEPRACRTMHEPAVRPVEAVHA